MKSGLYFSPGRSATASAAAWANWLLDPTTNSAKVKRGFSCGWSDLRSASFAQEAVATVAVATALDGRSLLLRLPLPFVLLSPPAASRTVRLISTDPPTSVESTCCISPRYRSLTQSRKNRLGAWMIAVQPSKLMKLSGDIQ